jgi:hypothetical protein
MEELFQMYDTDQWGSNSSRKNIGVFSSVAEALKSLVQNDSDRLIYIFENNNRLFIEKITLDEFDGYSVVFDSDISDNRKELKRIMFFESVESFRNDLSFLDVDKEEDIDFDIDAIESVDDVSDDLIEAYLNEENVIKFIKQNLEK